MPFKSITLFPHLSNFRNSLSVAVGNYVGKNFLICGKVCGKLLESIKNLNNLLKYIIKIF